MKKLSNAEIRQTAHKVNFLGSTIVSLFVFFAIYRLLSDQASIKEVLSILFPGLLVFIFSRSSAWMVSGFEQKFAPPPENETGASNPVSDDDPTQGSRFLHTKGKVSMFAKK